MTSDSLMVLCFCLACLGVFLGGVGIFYHVLLTKCVSDTHEEP